MCELRKRGVITAVICSEPFSKLAQAQSRAFGVPNLPLVIVPHPLGGLSLEHVEGRSLVASPSVIELIHQHAT